MKAKNIKNGFTLVELMIVVGILGILLTIAVPNYMATMQRSKEKTLRSDLSVVRAAVQAFHADTGAYPSALTDLSLASEPTQGKSHTGSTISITSGDYQGPYLATLPPDPISGNNFTYYSTITNNKPVGTVLSSATGNDSQGNAYATY